jgi:MFS family permease
VPRFACAVVFALAGGLLATFAARVPAIQERAGLSAGELGLLFLALEAGAIAGLPLGGTLSARIGNRRALRIGLAVYPAGLAWVGTTVWLAPALFVTAVGTSVVDVAMNAQGLELERRLRRPLLSRLHAAHSAGVLAGGLGGTLAAALGVPVGAHLVGVAGLGLVAGQLATLAVTDAPRAPGPLLAWPGRPLLWLAALAFAAFLVDGAASNWSAVQVGGGEVLAAAGFAAFASGLLAGRLVGDRTVARLGPERVVRLAGAVASVGVLAALVVPSLALAGWFAAGFGIAPVAPVVMRAAGTKGAVAPAMAIAAVTTVGYLGSFTGPPLIGGLAAVIGLDAALGVVLLACAAVAALAARAA